MCLAFQETADFGAALFVNLKDLDHFFRSVERFWPNWLFERAVLGETLWLDRGRVRRGRPGLAGSAPSGLVAVGVPAANCLSRIFVRVGNGLNGPTFTIPDSMPGSLDCAASLGSAGAGGGRTTWSAIHAQRNA